MLNSTILIKVKQRLNKLDSQDYINVEAWQILEAFNKAQVDWCRRNLHGTNTTKEGDLIWIPLFQKLMEVKFVEQERNFFQLGRGTAAGGKADRLAHGPHRRSRGEAPRRVAESARGSHAVRSGGLRHQP